mmetsp:Transcript_7679/g.25051  ORF Transcript_7679/g.25051 Transcript_7679/m.25051 type:complete len:227 (-) Transcript_7679:288-968(-)
MIKARGFTGPVPRWISVDKRKSSRSKSEAKARRAASRRAASTKSPTSETCAWFKRVRVSAWVQTLWKSREFTIICSIVSGGSSSWQATPMLMAVSSLSPVRTQTLTPASKSAWTVSGTPSCKRSSIAVDPIKRRPAPKALSASSIRTSIVLGSCLARLATASKSVVAARYFFSHVSNGLRGSSAVAQTKVRKPSALNPTMCSNVAAFNASWPGARRVSMTVSAPLT